MLKHKRITFQCLALKKGIKYASWISYCKQQVHLAFLLTRILYINLWFLLEPVINFLTGEEFLLKWFSVFVICFPLTLTWKSIFVQAAASKKLGNTFLGKREGKCLIKGNCFTSSTCTGLCTTFAFRDFSGVEDSFAPVACHLTSLPWKFFFLPLKKGYKIY